MTFHEFTALLNDSLKKWRADRMSLMAAALAYYTMFSLVPMLIVVIAIVGFVMGQDVAQAQLVVTLQTFVGVGTAQFVQDAIRLINGTEFGFTAGIAGTLIFIVGSIELLYKLQIAINAVWDTQYQGSAIKQVVRNRAVSFLLVIVSALLLFLSFISGAVLAVVSGWLNVVVPGLLDLRVWQASEVFFSFIVSVVLFATAYKVLPRTRILWNDVLAGSFVSAFLFTFGKVVIGWYLGTKSFTFYGAAGSLVAFLIWVYYSAQIFLYGSEITYVYTHRYGSKKDTKKLVDKVKETLKVAKTKLSV